MSRPKLRVVVVGAGLIGQAVHIPLLWGTRKRFELAGIADASALVCRELAARYPGVTTDTNWRRLLELDGIDAIFICSPNATHVEIALEALARGIHVFAEKPLALTVDDIDAIIAARDANQRVVQVGYMRRFDAGYASMLSELPTSPDKLRFLDIVTYDPWMARAPFAPHDLILATDVPEAARSELKELERAQIESVFGPADELNVRAFVDVYLGALIHDVNLVHGALEHMGIDIPGTPVFAGHRDDGTAATVVFDVAAGIRWHCSWLLLRAQEEFAGRVDFYFDDQIHELRFEAPYFRGRPTVYENRQGDGSGRQRVITTSEGADAYAGEIEHFYSCIVDGTECRAPAEQARADTVALAAAFRITAPTQGPAH